MPTVKDSTMDNVLDAACRFVARFEGFRSQPYQDVGGTWTIGFGFTRLGGKPVTQSTPELDREAALAILRAKLDGLMVQVRELVTVPINDNQIIALTDFAFNEGAGALARSTLLKLFNSGDLAGAAHQFGAWIYAGGAIRTDLVRRRDAERQLFIETPPLPA